MTTPLRVLLVGFGKIAAGYDLDPKTQKAFQFSSHFQVVSKHPQLILGGVVDNSYEARKMAIDRGIQQVFNDVEEVKSERWDLVVLATGALGRVSILKKLNNVGAILSEKPLGELLKDSTEFVSICKTRKIPLQVNYWRRGDLSLRNLASKNLSERIGKIQKMVGYYGNGLRNNGSHLIDMVQMLGGEIDNVLGAKAIATGLDYPIKQDLDADAFISLKSSALVHLCAVNFSHFREVALDIWGTRGRLAIVHEGLNILNYPAQPHRSLSDSKEINWEKPTVEETGSSTALYNIYDNIVRHIDHGEVLWSSGQQALRTEIWIDKILERIN